MPFPVDYRFVREPLVIPQNYFTLNPSQTPFSLDEEVRHSFKINQKYIDRPFDTETNVLGLVCNPTDKLSASDLQEKIHLFLFNSGVPNNPAFMSANCAKEIVENALKHAFRWKYGDTSSPHTFVSLIALVNTYAHRIIIGYEDPSFDPETVTEHYKLRAYFRKKNDKRFIYASSNMGLELSRLHFDQVISEVVNGSVEYRLTKIHLLTGQPR